MSKFFTKGVYSFKRFRCNRELIPDGWCSSILSLVLEKINCLETDDLRVLEISEKCSRFTKYVGCGV